MKLSEYILRLSIPGRPMKPTTALLWILLGALLGCLFMLCVCLAF